MIESLTTAHLLATCGFSPLNLPQQKVGNPTRSSPLPLAGGGIKFRPRISGGPQLFLIQNGVCKKKTKKKKESLKKAQTANSKPPQYSKFKTIPREIEIVSMVGIQGHAMAENSNGCGPVVKLVGKMGFLFFVLFRCFPFGPGRIPAKIGLGPSCSIGP